MAARKTPSGGGKPDKLIREALMVAVKRQCEDDSGKKTTYLNRIAAKVVSMAANGDAQAYKELFDRIEGKPAQSIGLGQAEDLKPLEAVVRPVLSRDEWLALHSAK